VAVSLSESLGESPYIRTFPTWASHSMRFVLFTQSVSITSKFVLIGQFLKFNFRVTGRGHGSRRPQKFSNGETFYSLCCCSPHLSSSLYTPAMPQKRHQLTYSRSRQRKGNKWSFSTPCMLSFLLVLWILLLLRATPSVLLDNNNKTKSQCAAISVIVPLTPDRLHFLPRLFDSIANNTRLPCEIILSVSSARKKPIELPILPTNLQTYTNVTLLTTTESKTAGGNRNRAAQVASMPIIAAIDSDDLAAPFWIEMTEQWFQNDTIDVLFHKYFWCQDGIPAHPSDSSMILPVNSRFPSNLTSRQAFDWACCNYKAHPPWTNGHVAVRKSVYLNVQQRETHEYWRSEDSYFTADLLQQGYQTMYVDQPLTGYCHEPINIHIPKDKEW